jgi:hypothetical protein
LNAVWLLILGRPKVAVSNILTSCWKAGSRLRKQDRGGGKGDEADEYRLRIAMEDALKGSIRGETLSAVLKVGRVSAL